MIESKEKTAERRKNENWLGRGGEQLIKSHLTVLSIFDDVWEEEWYAGRNFHCVSVWGVVVGWVW